MVEPPGSVGYRAFENHANEDLVMLKRLFPTSLPAAAIILAVGLIAAPARPETPSSAPASQPGMSESKKADQIKPLDGTIEKAAVTYHQVTIDGQIVAAAEVDATIVRLRTLEGTNRKVYGVRYDS
jgi:hypothetical protein